MADQLQALGIQMFTDSEIWFSASHARGHESTAIHFALGIGGEAGEVLDVIKKADVCGGFMDSCAMHADGKHSREALESELADLLTYVLLLAHLEDVDLASAYEAKRTVNAARWGGPDD